jgi:hypothetical protein
MTRRQFFAQMRKLGFKKSRIQMARNGLTYDRVDHDGRVTVTVPKGHEQTFTILGDVDYSGIYVLANERIKWGTHVKPELVGRQDMLGVCLGLCDGSIELWKE